MDKTQSLDQYLGIDNYKCYLAKQGGYSLDLEFG